MQAQDVHVFPQGAADQLDGLTAEDAEEVAEIIPAIASTGKFMAASVLLLFDLCSNAADTGS